MQAKNLIIMAHKLEARSFFSNYSFKKSDNLPYLYEHDRFCLFLCQMGQKNAQLNLNYLLKNRSHFHHIINLGIAGGVNPELKLHEICPIKKLCDSDGNLIDLNTPGGIYICQTVDRPILNPEDLKSIQPVDLIDMEAMGLYLSCKEFKLPFSSYKLISDFPGQQTDEKLIRAQFDTYSNQLFHYFKEAILSFFDA